MINSQLLRNCKVINSNYKTGVSFFRQSKRNNISAVRNLKHLTPENFPVRENEKRGSKKNKNMGTMQILPKSKGIENRSTI